MANARAAADMTSRVLISVVSWNSADSIQACLAALQAQTAPADILVVDNASSDGCLNLVRHDFPGVAIVQLPTNTGFCGGHNVALLHAREHGHDFVWLVNDDTHCAPETLARLLSAMAAQPDCHVLSPVIVNRVGETRSVEFCGAALDPRVLRKRKAKDATEALALAADPGLVPMVPGTALLIRRTLIDRIGLLNEHLFAYFDDDDFCTRCLKAGTTVHMCFDAEIWHDNPPFVQRSTHYHYLMARNRWLFWSSYFDGRMGAARRRRLAARTLREAGSLAGRGHVQSARAALRGLADAMRGRAGPPPATHLLSLPLFQLLNWHPFFLARLLSADDDA